MSEKYRSAFDFVIFKVGKRADPIGSNDMEFPTLQKVRSRSSSKTSMFKYDSFHAVLGKPEVDEEDDLFKSLKFYLIIGRLLGVLPFSGVFSKSSAHLQFCRKSPAAIVSITILVVLMINLILGIIDTVYLPKRNALEIAKSVRATIQFVWSCLIYLNFLIRGKQFLGLFNHWRMTSVFYGSEDRHLRRDGIFITLLILMSAILENAVLHLEYIRALDHISGERFGNNTDSTSVLETYYRRSNDHWAAILGYNEILAVIAFIQHKCMLYVVNYLDITLAVFSRAIYFKFKILHTLAAENLVQPLKNGTGLSKGSKSMSRHAWIQVAHDHKRLCDFLQHVEAFFSPFVFGSYAVNIYYICIQLFDGLTTDMNSSSLVHSIYAPWSFLHIIMRVFIVSICAARINVYSHQIGNVLQECPIEYYEAEVARLDKKVTTGPSIGLTGFGCFTVTKPFILQIIGVVFTFEIVLLQGVPSTSTPQQGIDC